MTSEADETVEDVLAELSRYNPEVRPVYAAVVADEGRFYDLLDIDDWLSAVKLSGGQIVIRCHGYAGNTVQYITRGKDGMLRTYSDTYGLSGQSYKHFMSMIDSDEYALRPRHVDDTPLSEVDV